jgi:hypothetical protein
MLDYYWQARNLCTSINIIKRLQVVLKSARGIAPKLRVTFFTAADDAVSLQQADWALHGRLLATLKQYVEPAVAPGGSGVCNQHAQTGRRLVLWMHGLFHGSGPVQRLVVMLLSNQQCRACVWGKRERRASDGTLSYAAPRPQQLVMSAHCHVARSKGGGGAPHRPCTLHNMQGSISTRCACVSKPDQLHGQGNGGSFLFPTTTNLGVWCVEGGGSHVCLLSPQDTEETMKGSSWLS